MQKRKGCTLKPGRFWQPEPETGQLVTLRRRAPCCWPVRPESILRSPEHPALSNLKVSEPWHLQKQLPRSSFSVWSTLIPRNLLLKIFLLWSERYKKFPGSNSRLHPPFTTIQWENHYYSYSKDEDAEVQGRSSLVRNNSVEPNLTRNSDGFRITYFFESIALPDKGCGGKKIYYSLWSAQNEKMPNMSFALHSFHANFFLNIHSLDIVYSIEGDEFHFYSFRENVLRIF